MGIKRNIILIGLISDQDGIHIVRQHHGCNYDCDKLVIFQTTLGLPPIEDGFNRTDSRDTFHAASIYWHLWFFNEINWTTFMRESSEITYHKNGNNHMVLSDNIQSKNKPNHKQMMRFDNNSKQLKT